MPSIGTPTQDIIDMTVEGTSSAFTIAIEGFDDWCDPVSLPVCEDGTDTEGFAPLILDHDGSADATTHYTRNGWHMKETA